jgi:hypothetical protein
MMSEPVDQGSRQGVVMEDFTPQNLNLLTLDYQPRPLEDYDDDKSDT